MKRLFLGLFVALGLLVTNASAQCVGCGQQGMPSASVQCDYSNLWNGFSPTVMNYTPDCWSGGCGKGILGGRGIGLLERMRSHVASGPGGGCGIACDAASPNIGWESIGNGCGGAGLGGYGGYGMSSFHGLSQGGHRLMGNSNGCCPPGGCFAGPCDAGSCGIGSCGTGGGLSCHSFQTGWLSGLMERLRGHCSARSYSGGSLDPCGSLSGCGSYPAGNIDVSFGGANMGCGGSCGVGGGCDSCGAGGGCGGEAVDSGAYGGGYGVDGSAGCGNGAIGTPTPTPHSSIEPQPAAELIEPPVSHPSAGGSFNSSPFDLDSTPSEYPSTSSNPLHQSAQPSYFNSVPQKTPAGFGRSQGRLDYVSMKR